MKSLMAGIAAAAVIAFSAINAHANSIFDLSGSSPGDYSLDYSVDGIGLNVTGGTFSSSTVGSETVSGGASVTRDGSGIGVQSDPNDNPVIDGDGGNDVVIFNFDQAVSLVSVTFSHYGDEMQATDPFTCSFTNVCFVPAPDDEFSFLADTDSNGVLNLITTNANANPFIFSPSPVGTLFGIGAWDNNDDFRVASVEVSVAPTPLPAALPLYGSGLAVVGFAGWRKRRKAAVLA